MAIDYHLARNQPQNNPDLELAVRVVKSFKKRELYDQIYDELVVMPHFNEMLISYQSTHKGTIKEHFTRMIFYLNNETKTLIMPNILGGIFINQEYRGLGLGRSLIETMEEIGKNASIKHAEIEGVGTPKFWLHMDYIQRGHSVFYKRL